MFGFLKGSTLLNDEKLFSLKRKNMAPDISSSWGPVNSTVTFNGGVANITLTAVSQCGMCKDIFNLVKNSVYVVEFEIKFTATGWKPNIMICDSGGFWPYNQYWWNDVINDNDWHKIKIVFLNSRRSARIITGTNGAPVGVQYQIRNVKFYKKGW